MKIGVFNPIFREMPLEEMLDRLVDLGLEAVEMRSGPNSVTEIERGRYACQEQCDPAVLLADAARLQAFKKAFADRGLFISALSCHGNPVHPDKAQARVYDEAFRNSVLLAERLEVPVVNVFSGCPGSGPGSTQPNWVVTGWPPEYARILQWQWDEVLIPYWREAVAFAADHGVKIAVEPHPGFCVYNTGTLLRLREAVGEAIGANFDPSHLFWQGMDPVAAIRALGEAIYHVHAKDTWVDPYNTAVNGVLDLTWGGDLSRRPWFFRTVGYGHGEATWRAIVSALRMAGYDYVLSIEHEDPLASRDDGLEKAVTILRACVFSEPIHT